MLVVVQVPRLIQDAVDNSIVSDRVPLSHYMWWLVGMSVIMLVVGYLSKQLLFRAAARIEYDLRNIVYEHLTAMSFPFYDRMQSGQLISRANSDIRAVQMYLAFAPYLLVQSGISLVSFAYMLAIDVPLAILAMLPMPLTFVASRRMQRSLFPVSWLIQARLADVATVVDENVNGVRVAKSFAAERSQLTSLQKAATSVAWANVKDADLRAVDAPGAEPAPRRHGDRAAVRRIPGHSRRAGRRRDPGLQRLSPDAPGSVPGDRQPDHAGAAVVGRGQAAVRGAGREAGDRARGRVRARPA